MSTQYTFVVRRDHIEEDVSALFDKIRGAQNEAPILDHDETWDIPALLHQPDEHDII